MIIRRGNMGEHDVRVYCEKILIYLLIFPPGSGMGCKRATQGGTRQQKGQTFFDIDRVVLCTKYKRICRRQKGSGSDER